MKITRLALAVMVTFTMTGCETITDSPLSLDYVDENTVQEDSSLLDAQGNFYQTPHNLEEIINDVTKATFLVECPKISGSGWGFSHNAFGESKKAIITNHHVIESCLEEGVPPVISDYMWNEFEAKVLISKRIESDPDSLLQAQDLAILMPKTDDFSAIKSYSASYAQGSWVMTSAYPDIDPGFFTHAITIGNIAAVSMVDGVIITAGINPGASGGVVVNAYGQAIGTIYSGYDDRDVNDAGFFLPMKSLWDLLRELELGGTTF